MGERKTCGTCMRPLPESTPYRKQGEVQREPEAAKAPKTDAARIVLEEEFREADEASEPILVVGGIGWVATGVLGGIAVGVESAGWGTVAAFGVVFSVACAIGYLRCRATIKAWRDQKRAKVGGPK